MSSSQYSSNAHVIGRSAGFHREENSNIRSPERDGHNSTIVPVELGNVDDYNSKSQPKSVINKAATTINFKHSMNNIGQQALNIE